MNNKKSIKEDYLDEFTCPICLSTLSNPVMTSCTHLFCEKCIKSWLLEDRRCPICKQYIPSNNNLKQAPRALKKIILKIEDLISKDLDYEPAAEGQKPDKIECIVLDQPIKIPKRSNGQPQVVYLN